jgi:hypothetical protein
VRIFSLDSQQRKRVSFKTDFGLNLKGGRNMNKAIWFFLPLSLLFSQGCATYPAVGSFGEYNELYKGTVTVNLFTLSSNINIEGVSSKTEGKGSSWVTFISPSVGCEGTKGGVLLKFSDGRIVNAEFTCLSCASGWGSGKDQGGNTFTFTFGMSDEEAEQFLEKTQQVIADRSSMLPAGEEPPKAPEPVEFEYDPETKTGYISVKGKGPEARSWMLKQIEEICASKNIVIQEGTKSSEPARFRVLSETFLDGKFTMKFELVR